MSKRKKAPAAPDPAASAAAQAQANRVNVFSRQGNQIYGTTNSQGKFVPSVGNQASMVLEQTPFQKKASDISESTAINLANSISPQARNLQKISTAGLPNYITSLDFSKIGAVPTMDQFAGQSKEAQDAYFQHAMNLMQPGMELDQRRIDQQLADQGLPIGSDAYNAEKDRLAREQGAQREQLSLASVGAGNQRANELYQQAMQSRASQIQDQLQQASLAQSGRQNMLGEQQGIRAQQLQELAALLGGNYQPTPMMQFTGATPIDVQGPINQQYQAQLANWQAQQNNQTAAMNGLFGIAGSALGSGGVFGA